MRITEKEDINILRGSKYAQSNLSDTFSNIDKDLMNNKLVLFSGTPCQTAALRALFQLQPKLILCDIVCHGVASPLVFKKYWAWLEKNNGKIIEYKFRDKNFRWNEQRWSVKYINGETDTRSYDFRSFKNMYYKTLIHRPSCFKCPYTTPDRNSDFTMGDFWGIEKWNPKFMDDDGVSLVITHTEQGYEIWNQISCRTEFYECEREDCIQPQLEEPVKKECKDNNFWNNFSKNNRYEDVVKKYGYPSLQRQIKDSIRKILKM